MLVLNLYQGTKTTDSHRMWAAMCQPWFFPCDASATSATVLPASLVLIRISNWLLGPLYADVFKKLPS